MAKVTLHLIHGDVDENRDEEFENVGGLVVDGGALVHLGDVTGTLYISIHPDLGGDYVLGADKCPDHPLLADVLYVNSHKGAV